MSSKVRWGVLGVAKIAVQKVIPPMQQAEHCDVVAIASRDLSRAEKAAKDLGIDVWWDTPSFVTDAREKGYLA